MSNTLTLPKVLSLTIFSIENLWFECTSFFCLEGEARARIELVDVNGVCADLKRKLQRVVAECEDETLFVEVNDCADGMMSHGDGIKRHPERTTRLESCFERALQRTRVLPVKKSQ